MQEFDTNLSEVSIIRSLQNFNDSLNSTNFSENTQPVITTTEQVVNTIDRNGIITPIVAATFIVPFQAIIGFKNQLLSLKDDTNEEKQVRGAIKIVKYLLIFNAILYLTLLIQPNIYSNGKDYYIIIYGIISIIISVVLYVREPIVLNTRRG